MYDNIVYLKEIKKQDYRGKKILSTIYWPFDDYASNGAPFLQKMIFKVFGVNGFEFVKAFAKLIIKKESIYLNGLKKSYIEIQKDIVKDMDWFLPNAELEMQALNTRLDLNLTTFSIVNNAIDTNIFDKLEAEKSIVKNNNLITFVARIDARKNQLNFLKSMMDTKYQIRFIGNAGPNSKNYLKKLKKLANRRGNVEFISHIPQEEVFIHMMEAKVNVLTSWIETPGLVSLEAGYAKCNIVVSDKGSVRDYFRDYAYYCQPDNIEDIKEKVIDAMNKPFNNNFRELIKSEYTWENTATQTMEAYKKVLSK